MRRSIRRKLYSLTYPCGQGIQWSWYNDITWVPYDMETSFLIENQYTTDRSCIIDLEQTLGIPNYIDLKKMVQVNKYTRTGRSVERKKDISFKYPIDKSSSLGHHSNVIVNNHPSSGSQVLPAANNRNRQAMNNAITQTVMFNNDCQKTTAKPVASGNDVLYRYCKAGAVTNNLNEVGLV